MLFYVLFEQHVKPRKIEFEPKYKKKGRSKAGKKEKRKQGVRAEITRQEMREAVKNKQELEKTLKISEKRFTKKPSVLDRFKKKDEKK